MFSQRRSILGDGATKNSRVIGHWLLMGLAVAAAVLGMHSTSSC